jgi:hypothetical protein
MEGKHRSVGTAADRRAAARRWLARAVALGLVALPTPGCTAPRPPLVVTDPDPSVKIPAYKKAVRKKDKAAVRQLVADLDNDDPAVRLYSIQALRRLTGETFGYRYFQADEQRRPAVQKWRQWLEAGEKAAGEKPPRRP